LVSKLEELFQKHVLIVDAAPNASFSAVTNQILINEKRIFVYRLALINAFGLAQLEEIYTHSRNVFGLMDDWVVDAVDQENKIC